MANALNINSAGIVSTDAAGSFFGRSITQPAAGITVANADGTGGNPTLALANDLAAVEGLATAGVASRTAADTWGTSSITANAVIVGAAGELLSNIGPLTDGQLVVGSTGVAPVAASLSAPAAGITITGGAGTVTFALSDDLEALEGLTGTGLVARTAADTYAERTITGTSNEVDVSDGNGVSGNPTLSFSATPKMAQLTIDPGASGDSFVQFDINSTGEYRIGVDDDDGDAFVISQGSALGTNNLMRASSSGEFLYPSQPGFLALASDQINATGAGTTHTIAFASSEVFDRGNVFSSPTFTAPITGIYLIGCFVELNALDGSASSANLVIVTSNRNFTVFVGNSGNLRDSGDDIRITGCVVANMDASDTATITTTVSGMAGDTVTVGNGCKFYAWLLG